MISKERRAELRAQCEPPVNGTHKPVAYWDLRALLDCADERDEAEGALHWLAEQLGLPDDGPGKNVGEAVAALYLAQKQRDEAVELLWEVRCTGVTTFWRNKVDALLRRVGGSDE